MQGNRLNSRWGSFTTGIGLRAIVEPPSMHWRNCFPAHGGWRCRLSLEQARLPIWRLWARDAAIEKKDVLKTRGYAWSPGEFGRPKCWYRDVSDADKCSAGRRPWQPC